MNENIKDIIIEYTSEILFNQMKEQVNNKDEFKMLSILCYEIAEVELNNFMIEIEKQHNIKDYI